MQIPGYQIIRKINSGGMASVYLAIQVSVGRTVALKIMKPELDQDPEFHQRFKREAEIVGQLSHPNVIPIYDVGRHNGLNFISMEYLPGGSADEKIISGLTANEVTDIIIAIANALEHAHNRGYVHRDIKPENILFRADKTAVLTDFGIAKTLKTNLKMTQAGNVIGTPYYMSPEQAKGLDTDGRSDLYSLGILCYEMLTGSRPFRSETSLALAIQHIDEQPPNLPIQYFTFQPILDRLLAKKPEQRFQTARDLITELEELKNTTNTQLLPTRGSAKSFQLLKIIGHTIAQDIRLLANRTAPLYHRLVAKIKQKNNAATILVSSESTPEIHNAETGVHPISSSIENSLPKKLLIKIAIGFSLFLTILFISTHQFGGNKSGHREQWKSFFHADSNNSNDAQLTLTVITQPETATVRILNIVEKYTPGIELPAGEYHINIKALGYETADTWIKLTQDNQTVEVSLNKTSEKNRGEPEALITPKMVEVPDSNFLIGKYEVTFNEYDNFAVATNRSLPDDNGWGRGDHPVINVSWDDAQAYTNWLSKITGSHYRLPTNAEWEFAARGNTTSSYWWGNSESDSRERANCRFDCKSLWSSLFDNKTVLVGNFPDNDFGIHDSAGNVAEWVEDCYSPDENQTCGQRIIRGGSFKDSAKNIASTSTSYLAAHSLNTQTGFRVVRDADSDLTSEKESTKAPAGNALQRLLNKLRR